MVVKIEERKRKGQLKVMENRYQGEVLLVTSKRKKEGDKGKSQGAEDQGVKEKTGHKENGLTSRSFRGTGLRLFRAAGERMT